jgi:hypothetical protein
MSAEWRGRPAFARIIRVVVALAPILVTIAISYALARALPPIGSGRERLAWWLFLLGVTLGSLYLLDKLFRRFAPLATLLRISLVFPDQAPSRFGTALRAGSTKKLQKKIDEIALGGDAFDSNTAYAAQMLELIAMLGEHDRLTRGHCERVRAYTDLIMAEMDINGTDANQLRWAALLHDLGKLMVPAAILNKPTRPTETEWEVLKTHPAEGARLAEPITEWLGEWFRTIGEHHERWDGQGYPAGLAQTDIHLGARVVAVADTYDVITSSRSYKDPIPAADARAEIARHAGTQFDPKIVRAFLAIGIGRLRFIAGPLAWITSLFGLSSAPVGVASTVAATALTIATVGVVVPGPSDSGDEIAVPRTELGFSNEGANLDPPVPRTSSTPPQTTTTSIPTAGAQASTPTTMAAPNEPSTTSDPPTTPTTSTTTPATTTPATATPITAAPTTTTPTTATTSTAAPRPPLVVGPNQFIVAPETRTGDVVGTLSDSNALPGLTWTASGSEPFSVDPDGTVRLADEEDLYDNSMYGSQFTFAVEATAPDGASDGGEAELSIAQLSTSTEGVVISEAAVATGANAQTYVEIVNSSGEAREIRAMMVEVEAERYSRLVATDDYVLFPAETVMFKSQSSGPSGPAVRSYSFGDSTAIDIGFDQEFAVQLSVASSPTTLGSLYAGEHVVDGIGTRASAAGYEEGSAVGDLPRFGVGELMSYARRGSSPNACVDSDNNLADFDLLFNGSHFTPTPGSSPCRPMPVPKVAGSGLLISEIRTRGFRADDDYVEIHNPTGRTISLVGVSLRLVREDNGATEEISFNAGDPVQELTPGQHFLVAGSGYGGPADRVTSQLRIVRGRFSLRDPAGVVDGVSVGDMADGLWQDSAGPESWVRRHSGTQDTDVDRKDFQYSGAGSPTTSAD